MQIYTFEKFPESCAILRSCDVVGDDAQRNDHAAEFAEAVEPVVAREYERARGDGVCIGSVLVGCNARCDADAKAVYEGEGEEKFGEGHEEGLPFRNFRGVIDVEVRGGGGIGDAHGEGDGKERETVGLDGCRVADGLGGCV